MALRQGIAGLACAALLCACAPMTKTRAMAPPAPPIGALMADAEQAAQLGQPGRAQALLQAAAAAYPADKEPWLRMAQRSMDGKNYRDALNQALEVLARDGDDRAAHAIVVLSGARIANQSADSLARGPLWSGAARIEAQDLSKQLHASVGDPPGVRGAQPPRPLAPPAVKARPPKDDDDPLGALKRIRPVKP